MAALLASGADVLALQEVGLQEWTELLLPELRAAGFDGLWQDPPGRRAAFQIGNAVLWRSAEFRCCASEHLSRSLVVQLEQCANGGGGGGDDDGAPGQTGSRALPPGAERSRIRLTLANVHLSGRRGAGGQRLKELGEALRSASRLAGDATTGPLVVCGYDHRHRPKRRPLLSPRHIGRDFNSGRTGATAHLLQHGRVPKTLSDRGYQVRLGKDAAALTHRWGLANTYDGDEAACAAASVTAARGGRLSSVDMMWHTPGVMAVRCVRQTTELGEAALAELVENGLPSEQEPSDHLPIAALYEIPASPGEAKRDRRKRRGGRVNFLK